MQKSLAKEFSNFCKNNYVLVLSSELKSKVGNITIPKTRLKQILTDDDVYHHHGSEIISFKQLTSELGISRSDFDNYFSEQYSALFDVINPDILSKNKSLDKTNFSLNKKSKLALSIFDLILSETGWNSSDSNWYIQSPSIGIDSIDKFGYLVSKSSEKSRYKSFNVVNRTKLILEDPSLLSDKKLLLEKLNLYNEVIYIIMNELKVSRNEVEEKLQNYLRTHSQNFVIKLNITNHDQNNPIVYISVGVEVSSKLTGVDAKLAVHTFNLKLNDLLIIVNFLVARKKLLHKFITNGIVLSPLNSIKKEKSIWFNDDMYLYQYSIEDKEADLITSLIKTIFYQQRKNTPATWRQLERVMQEVSHFYKVNKFEESHIPSGPDTSKFVSVVSGKIEFKENFNMGSSYYHSGTNFKYGLQIGGNYKYGNPYAVMFYILKYISKVYGLPLNIDKPAHIRCASGTSYSAVGVN